MDNESKFNYSKYEANIEVLAKEKTELQRRKTALNYEYTDIARSLISVYMALRKRGLKDSEIRHHVEYITPRMKEILLEIQNINNRLEEISSEVNKNRKLQNESDFYFDISNQDLIN